MCLPEIIGVELTEMLAGLSSSNSTLSELLGGKTICKEIC